MTSFINPLNYFFYDKYGMENFYQMELRDDILIVEIPKLSFKTIVYHGGKIRKIFDIDFILLGEDMIQEAVEKLRQEN